MRAIQYWQDHTEALPVLSDPTAASEEPEGPLPLHLSLRFVDAVIAVIPGSSTFKAALLARIMLAVHHPLISAVRRDPSLGWKAVKKRIPHVERIIEGKSSRLVL